MGYLLSEALGYQKFTVDFGDGPSFNASRHIRNRIFIRRQAGSTYLRFLIETVVVT